MESEVALNKVTTVVEEQNPHHSAFLGSAKILEKSSQVGSAGWHRDLKLVLQKFGKQRFPPVQIPGM